MKNQFIIALVIVLVAFLFSGNVCNSQVYESDLPIEDVIKYTEILKDINNYNIPRLCDTTLYNKYSGWDAKMEYIKNYYANYRLFQKDSSTFFTALQEFYSSKKNILKYLLKFRNSTSSCSWASGWYTGAFIQSSFIDVEYHNYLTNKNIAAFILISNYILNTDKNSIRLYITSDRYSNDELYNKLEKVIKKNYNMDLETLREKMRLEFKDEFYNEFQAEEYEKGRKK